MSAEAISSVTAAAFQAISDSTATAATNLAAADPSRAGGVSFDTVLNGLESLNDQLVQGQEAIHAMALGQVENLHHAMIAGEQTRLAFELMLQVRSKFLDAYQELLRMQV